MQQLIRHMVFTRNLSQPTWFQTCCPVASSSVPVPLQHFCLGLMDIRWTCDVIRNTASLWPAKRMSRKAKVDLWTISPPTDLLVRTLDRLSGSSHPWLCIAVRWWYWRRCPSHEAHEGLILWVLLQRFTLPALRWPMYRGAVPHPWRLSNFSAGPTATSGDAHHWRQDADMATDQDLVEYLTNPIHPTDPARPARLHRCVSESTLGIVKWHMDLSFWDDVERAPVADVELLDGFASRRI